MFYFIFIAEMHIVLLVLFQVILECIVVSIAVLVCLRNPPYLFNKCAHVTGRVVQIWTTQDDTNDDGIFRLSTWLF